MCKLALLHKAEQVHKQATWTLQCTVKNPPNTHHTRQLDNLPQANGSIRQTSLANQTQPRGSLSVSPPGYGLRDCRQTWAGKPHLGSCGGLFLDLFIDGLLLPAVTLCRRLSCATLLTSSAFCFLSSSLSRCSFSMICIRCARVLWWFSIVPLSSSICSSWSSTSFSSCLIRS